MKSLVSILAVIVSVVVLFVVLFVGKEQNLKGAPTGLYSTLSIATTTAVGKQEVKTLFSSNKQCTGRVITSVAAPLMIIFGDPTNGDLASTTLSGELGHLQAASTTVMYDSGTYGCGRVSAYAFSSTTITHTEFK